MTTPHRFDKDFTTPPPIPEEGQRAALALMQSGQLHRYCTGEDNVSALEARFAEYTGARYALACASGGAAMRLALRGLGLGPGDKVLTNAFTLQPVPGAIAAIGASPVMVATTEALTIDLEDLARAHSESGASTLLLSHMRGHSVDMDALMAWADAHSVSVVEDCAHTLGAFWDGRASGRFGRLGCYSLQSYKHINCGEGGLITTDDEHLAAKLTLLSGCYHFYDSHGAAPDAQVLASHSANMPNISSRLDRLRAAIALPQIDLLDERRRIWRQSYDALAETLSEDANVALPERDPKEDFVGSSLQFRLPGWPKARIEKLVNAWAARGVAVKWFGAPPKGFTSTHRDWRYIHARDLGQTDRILSELLDIRLPLAFTPQDCRLIGTIVTEEIAKAAASG